MRIGVFGGTFNPIHYGHLRAAEEVREMLGFGKILFIPSGNPPLKDKDLADAPKRFAMTKLATKGNGYFEVLDIEFAKPGKSYTVETIEILKRAYMGSDLYFILGIDAFLEMPKWRQPDTLVAEVNFVVLSRPGRSFTELGSSPYLRGKEDLLKDFDRGETVFSVATVASGKEIAMVKVTPLAISSTEIRRRSKSGYSIKYLLPPEVESFIISNRLYADL